MKKFVSILIIAVMILSMTACGNNDTGNNTDTGSQSSVTDDVGQGIKDAGEDVKDTVEDVGKDVGDTVEDVGKNTGNAVEDIAK